MSSKRKHEDIVSLVDSSQSSVESSHSSIKSSQSDEATTPTITTPRQQSAIKRAKPFVPPQRVKPTQSASKPFETPLRSTAKKNNVTKNQPSDPESQVRQILQSSCCQLFTSHMIQSRLAKSGTVLNDREIRLLLEKINNDTEAVGCFPLPSGLDQSDIILHLQPFVPPASVTDLALSQPIQQPQVCPSNDLVTPKKHAFTTLSSDTRPSPSILVTPSVPTITPKSTNHLAGGMSSDLRARLGARRGPILLPSKLTSTAQSPATTNPTPSRSTNSSSTSSAVLPTLVPGSIAALLEELATTNRSIAKLQAERLLKVDTNDTARLGVLGDKWLQVCQSALQDLLDDINKNRGTETIDMPTLLRMLQLDHEQLQYSIEAEEFLDPKASSNMKS